METSTSSKRKKLLSYIKQVDDKKINDFYSLLQKELDNSDMEYSDEFKAELDRRYEDYKSGKTKMISQTESKRRISKILKTKFDK